MNEDNVEILKNTDDFSLEYQTCPTLKYYSELRYTVRRKKQKYWYRGISIKAGTLGNCQSATVVNGNYIADFTKEELSGIISEYTNTCNARNQWVIDVYTYSKDRIIANLKAVGCVIVLASNYTNKTGNEMTIIIVDLVPDVNVDSEGTEFDDYDDLHTYEEDTGELVYRRNEDTELLNKEW